jgi:hypothetical protein
MPMYQNDAVWYGAVVRPLTAISFAWRQEALFQILLFQISNFEFSIPEGPSDGLTQLGAGNVKLDPTTGGKEISKLEMFLESYNVLYTYSIIVLVTSALDSSSSDFSK